MRRFMFGFALFSFFSVAVRSQTQPPSSFVDNFDQPVLDSAWQLHPGDSQISLTANPGFLRYQLGAPQFNSNATDDTNSLWVFRQFSGDSWTLETRVTYSLPTTENGRQMLVRIPFPDTSGRNVNEVRWWRDVDCCGPRNRIVIDFTDNGQLSTGAILSPNATDTYVFRIVRRQQALEVQVSSDGTTFSSVAQYTYATPLPNLQDVVLSSANFCCTGYADYDYMTVVSAPLYQLCLLYDSTSAVNSGATLPVKLQLCDGSGNDLSSSSITLHATSLTQTSTSISGAVQAAGNANPDNDFRFDSTLGSTGGYIFNLKTTGLSTGTYTLNFTVTGDTFVYAVPFEVK